MNQNLRLGKAIVVFKIVLLQTCIVLLGFGISFAQSPAAVAVKGRVTDGQMNKPLAGVTVSVKGTKTGVTSDINGDFSVSASASSILVFSYVGYKTTEILVGKQTVVNVELQVTGQLKDVIVTALGITRERRSVGYSVTEIK